MNFRRYEYPRIRVPLLLRLPAFPLSYMQTLGKGLGNAFKIARRSYTISTERGRGRAIQIDPINGIHTYVNHRGIPLHRYAVLD